MQTDLADLIQRLRKEIQDLDVQLSEEEGRYAGACARQCVPEYRRAGAAIERLTQVRERVREQLREAEEERVDRISTFILGLAARLGETERQALVERLEAQIAVRSCQAR